MSISQFTTPVKPLETSTRFNTPEKPLSAPLPNLRINPGGVSVSANHSPLVGGANPSPLIGTGSTLSRGNSAVYNSPSALTMPQEPVHFTFVGECGQMPTPPHYTSGGVVAPPPQYTSSDCIAPPQYTSGRVTPANVSVSSATAEASSPLPPGGVPASLTSLPPRKTSSNSSTGGDDYDEGEHTPMVPRTKARTVRISKQSNV